MKKFAEVVTLHPVEGSLSDGPKEEELPPATSFHPKSLLKRKLRDIASFDEPFDGLALEVKETIKQVKLAWDNGEPSSWVPIENCVVLPEQGDETDDEIRVRLQMKFDALTELCIMVARKNINGLLVRGSGGIGKTHTSEECLLKYAKENEMCKLRIVKGHITGMQLFVSLFEARNPGDLIVFDDCNNVFNDGKCLEILKAAMDTRKHRVVNWQSSVKGLPVNEFIFEGNVIIITNSEPKGDENYKAFLDRIHNIDFNLTVRERVLRIADIAEERVRNGEIDKEVSLKVLNWMKKYAAQFEHKLTLRTYGKILDLANGSNNWEALARLTVLESRT